VSDQTPTLTVPDAGWYPDRNDPSTQRWWDGQQWTDDVRTVAGAATSSSHPVSHPVSASVFGLGPAHPVAPAPVAPAPVSPVPVAPTSVAPTPVAPMPVPTVAVAPAIIAAWYADPGNPSIRRWWDGQQWTQHTAPTGAAAYQPEPSYALTAGLVSGARPVTYAINSLATRGMIYSLIALLLNPLFIMSIGGLVNGIRALRRAPSFLPANARRGQAIAAIIIGVVATVFSVIAVVSAIQVYAATHRG
jgi:hypothetical protein